MAGSFIIIFFDILTQFLSNIGCDIVAQDGLRAFGHTAGQGVSNVLRYYFSSQQAMGFSLVLVNEACGSCLLIIQLYISHIVNILSFS